MTNEPVDIGSARQLFVDHYLIDSMRDTRLVLHQPTMRAACASRSRTSPARRSPALRWTIVRNASRIGSTCP